MEEEPSDDELPSITLSQDSNHREVVMPSAREVADQRAREMRTELELQRLRELHSPPPGLPPAPAPAPPRSDSSGSEGEAALAAAVRALRVLPPPPARAAHAPVARRLIASLPAPPHMLHQYAAAFADDISPAIRRKLINRMVHAMGCALAGAGAAGWGADARLTCAGVAAAASLCAAPPAPAPRRLLHRALAAPAPAPLAARLAHLLALAARPAGGGCGEEGEEGARALLAAADAARGGPAGAARLARLLPARALRLLLAPGLLLADESSPPLSTRELAALVSAASWRALAPPARHTALRLVARALAAGASETDDRARLPPVTSANETDDCARLLLATSANEIDDHTRLPPATSASETDDRARLLAALAHPPQTSDKLHPDYLKVVVAASTLQLLFRTQPT